MKNNKLNVFAIIGIVVTVISILSVAAYFIYRYVNKKRALANANCFEFDCADCTAEDCNDCPMTENFDGADSITIK